MMKRMQRFRRPARRAGQPLISVSRHLIYVGASAVRDFSVVPSPVMILWDKKHEMAILPHDKGDHALKAITGATGLNLAASTFIRVAKIPAGRYEPRMIPVEGHGDLLGFSWSQESAEDQEDHEVE